MSTDTLIWLTVHCLSPWCWQMFFNFHFVVCGVAWLHHEYEYHPIWLILFQIWKDNFLKMVATRYLLSPTASVNIHWPVIHTIYNTASLYVINNYSKTNRYYSLDKFGALKMFVMILLHSYDVIDRYVIISLLGLKPVKQPR